MRKALPVMNVPSGHHEQRADGPYLIWGADTPDRPRDNSIMRRYRSLRGPVSSSFASAVKIMRG
jgi:hypothetical protein